MSRPRDRDERDGSMANGHDQRRPTMADVAREAGVSAMTVSYTYSRPERVSPATAERVLAAARRLGYSGPHPGARSLRRRRAGSLGVVLAEPLTYAFQDPGAARFLAGIATVCGTLDLNVMLITLLRDHRDPARVAGASVDAFVFWTTFDGDPVLAAAQSTGLPLVIHGGPALDGIPVVTVDDRAAAAAVAAHALPGRRRPAVVSNVTHRDRRPGIRIGPDVATMTYPVTRHRLEGYRDALVATGHRWAEVPVAVSARNDRSAAERQAAVLLSGPDRPDAILAQSDELAIGVLTTCDRLGLRVPEDVTLTGWDDSVAARRSGLTTVRQSLFVQGRLCAALALGVPGPDRADAVRWSVVTRRSTGSA